MRVVFRRKRDKMLDGLRSLGVRVEREPEGTFYVWGNLARLPPSLRTGEQLFRKALEHKIITVPGQFFDVDPGQRRIGRPSRFAQHTRFSFGPSEDVIDTALARLRALVEAEARD
jgi:aspartate/methionine/tyrosine aminotransferase